MEVFPKTIWLLVWLIVILGFVLYVRKKGKPEPMAPLYIGAAILIIFHAIPLLYPYEKFEPYFHSYWGCTKIILLVTGYQIFSFIFFFPLGVRIVEDERTLFEDASDVITKLISLLLSVFFAIAVIKF